MKKIKAIILTLFFTYIVLTLFCFLFALFKSKEIALVIWIVATGITSLLIVLVNIYFIWQSMKIRELNDKGRRVKDKDESDMYYLWTSLSHRWDSLCQWAPSYEDEELQESKRRREK